MNNLDLDRLENVKRRGGKTIARCPACAASGADKSGEHLVIYESGAWGCIAFAGDKPHRREIASRVCIASPVQNLRTLVRRIVEPTRPPLELPALRVPTIGELAQLANLRSLPFFAGAELAVMAGQLRMAELPDAGETVTAWVLLDSSRRNAQARRLDGKLWHLNGKREKAKTLRGSQAAWPIGAADIRGKSQVALCEGGPDTLAAWSLAWWHAKVAELAPVCMAGSGMRIPPDALPLFRGKGIYLFPHRDKAGQHAQEVWTAQLIEAGAAWVKAFDVAPHKDLNEFLTAGVADLGDEL